MVVGVALLVGTVGCDESAPVGSRLSVISEFSVTASGRDSRRSPSVIDLGDVPPGGQVSRWIEINNPGSHDVEVGEVRVGCECATVTLDANRIPAGDSVRALVHADFAHLPDFRGGLGVKVEVFDRDKAKVEEFRVDLYVAE